ncbi:MAG: FG-GAP-like repeat-containing protein [Bacteroidales bacterium]|nr:FG-GAP-like repeat-containing protein [Bacteroidales bacterium]
MKKLTLLFLAITLLAFTVGDSKSEYQVPRNPETIFSCDIDLDGDIDIQTGHSYSSQTQWGGGAFLMNDGLGYYDFMDTIYFYPAFHEVSGNFFDNNEYVDIYSPHATDNPYTVNVAIIYNYGDSQFDSIKEFPIYYETPVHVYSSGDVSGDEKQDIVFACNNDFLWGIIYNDGTGNFSVPEYFDLSYPPLDITCADLNDDGRADVVIAGGTIEVYFSTETGFQQQLLGNALPWSSCYSLLTSDFDNDNDYDVILSTTSNSNHSNVYMFENLGNMQFYEHPYFEFTPFCSYSQIADFNNDSLPDIIFNTSDYSGLHIYYNKNDFQLEFSQFIPIEYSAPHGLNCNDFDNNGFNDIATFTANLNPDYFLKVLFNDGNGNFQENPITYIQQPETYNKNKLSYYPNPFNTELNIKYKIKESSFVENSVFNLSGELIRVLTNKQQKGGNHLIKWDGLDYGGKPCKPGPYLLTFKVNGIICKSTKIIKY